MRLASCTMAVVTLMVLLGVAQGALAWREGRPRMVVNYMAGEQGESFFSCQISHDGDDLGVKRKRKILRQVERSAHAVHWVIGHHWPLPPCCPRLNFKLLVLPSHMPACHKGMLQLPKNEAASVRTVFCLRLH